MDHTVVPGYSYAVTASEDCTLTAANGWKLELKAGIQQHFTAQFDSFSSTAPITLNVNFKHAPAAGSAGGMSEDDLVGYGLLYRPVSESLEVVQSAGNKVAVVNAGGFSCTAQNLSQEFNAVRIYGASSISDLVLKLKVGTNEVSSVRALRDQESVLFYFEQTLDRRDVKQFTIMTEGGALVMFVFAAQQNKPAGFASVSWGGTSSSYFPRFELCIAREIVGEPCPRVDAVPTEGSAMPVSSGGVFAAIAALGGGSADPESCEWALCYLHPLIANYAPNFGGHEETLEAIAKDASSYGGVMLPLGKYAVLLRKGGNSSWNDNDWGMFVVQALRQFDDLAREARFIYFNFN